MEILSKQTKDFGYYKTVAVGTIGELVGCNRIILYKSTTADNKLSLDKLNNIKFDPNDPNIINNSLGITESKILNKTDSNNFIYNSSSLDKLQEGFNTIVYINYKNQAIGFTEFYYTQGLVAETIIITVDIKTVNIIVDNIIKTNNDLSTLKPKSNGTESGLVQNKSKTLLESTDKLYGLTTPNRINKELKNAVNIYPRYTKNISELQKNREMNIFFDFGICNSTGFYKLNLIKEMTIAEDLKNHQLGYYRGEIVLYSWKEESGVFSYSINSLSRKDKFGNPICYTNTSTKTKEIKSFSSSEFPNHNKIKNIRYFSGRYISVTISSSSGKDDIYSIYNIDLEDWIALDSGNHIMDLWGIDSQIIELPSVNRLSKSSLLSFCPDVINTHIDIKNYIYDIDIEKKIGEWYVFNQTRISTKNKKKGYFKVYTNFTKTIILSKTSEYIDEDPIILNNNILALRTKTTNFNKTYDYYTYFIGDGTYYSENALLVLDKIYNDNDITWKELYYPRQGLTGLPYTIINKLQICAYYDNYHTLENKYNIKSNVETNYGTNLLVDHIGNSIERSFLSGFRRFVCPEDKKNPEIIGTINGLIYYKTKDNKIKLL